MTTVTFTALFVIVICAMAVAMGFYHLGYHDGKDGGRGNGDR